MDDILADFEDLPLTVKMRAAAAVLDEFNSRFSAEHPMAGHSSNEPVSASSLRGVADHWGLVVTEQPTPPMEGL